MLQRDLLRTHAVAVLLLLSLPALGEDVLRFDFGTGDSPLAEGYARVTKDTLYSPQRGFGWAAVEAKWGQIAGKPAAKPGTLPGLFDRDREQGTALDRDLVMSVREYHPLVKQTLIIDIPDGDYEVAILSGDPGFPSGAFTVSLESHEPMNVAGSPAGQFTDLLSAVKVTDGQLNIAFDAEEYWVVNALLVYPLARADEVKRSEDAFFGYRHRAEEGRRLRRELEALPVDELRKRCLPYLRGICEWIIERDLGSNELKGVSDTSHSIFINGNLARVLLSAYVITGEGRYRDEALRWCDSFISEQNEVETSRGNSGGWWSDVGPNNNIYLADTGTATSALVFALRFMDEDQRARSLAALERFARFVREGTKADPQGRGREVCEGWIISEGPDAGALGCGYYRGHLSVAPYTISTATTGCLMFSQLFAVTGNQEYRAIAIDAARWLLGIIREDGRTPYILDGETGTDAWWLVGTYVGEALMAAHDIIADDALRGDIREGLRRLTDRAIREQSPEGIWGSPGGFDGQRSGLVPQLLWWRQHHGSASPEVEQALRRNYAYLLSPALSDQYGVNRLVRPTGFVGLAAADFIQPGLTLLCGYLGR